MYRATVTLSDAIIQSKVWMPVSIKYATQLLWKAQNGHISLWLSHIQPRVPYDLYHPYDFLPVRPCEAPVGILRRCCHIRLRAPYGLTWLYTYHGLVEWFAGLHGYPVRCPCGHRTGPARESAMFLISYGTRMGLVRDPQVCRMAPLRTR